MAPPISEKWQCVSPSSIVVGDGPYAMALSATLEAELLPLERLNSGPDAEEHGGYPRLLEKLERVFLVVSEAMPPADAVQCHQAVWEWVVKLTSAESEHDLAFFFILPADASADFVAALGVALSVSEIAPKTGHGTWRRSDSLLDLLALVGRTNRVDYVKLGKRRSSDNRRISLARLCTTMRNSDESAALEAVRDVLAAFERRQYHLELFCRPPRHRHGALLYAWLDAGVTGPVTQDWWATGRMHLNDWLAKAPTTK